MSRAGTACRRHTSTVAETFSTEIQYDRRMREIRNDRFYGWRVVSATFVLAVFGLGTGFHGPAVYLHAVHERTGWPLALISTAVTLHFLVGAAVVANLPALHRRFGIPAVTKAGA